MEKNKIISFDRELNTLNSDIQNLSEDSDNVDAQISETKDQIEQLKSQIEELMGITLPPRENDDVQIETLNVTLRDLSDPSLPGDIKLTTVDTIVAITAGIVASVIDIVFVGTPEVVKIYKGGENFDGSILTSLLRKVGTGDLSEMLQWLSDKCKVPYDISAVKDTVDPNNHRLRSFGHDPLLGLIFAVVDILLGTATVVDDHGMLRVLVNSREYPMFEKYLAVIYYLGHLISDVCTARGLPIPGFVLTQFFAGNGEDGSIARIAEAMYKDGYDLRHLASMSTPVIVKNMITDAYLRLCRPMETKMTIAEREVEEKKHIAYKYRLRLVSDAVSCGGNCLKFFILPTKGNITALNLPEWISLIKNTLINLKYQLRDKTVETVLFNREVINDNWNELLKVGRVNAAE